VKRGEAGERMTRMRGRADARVRSQGYREQKSGNIHVSKLDVPRANDR